MNVKYILALFPMHSSQFLVNICLFSSFQGQKHRMHTNKSTIY